jgi:hypothetical protein
LFKDAAIPSILYLTLSQWSLVAGGLASFWYLERRRGRCFRLALASAGVFLSASMVALLFLPNGQSAGAATWRTWLLIGTLPVLACWGLLGWKATPGGEGTPRRAGWIVPAAVLHAVLFLLAAVWFCHWFIALKANLLAGYPAPEVWLAASVAVNRMVGALQLGVSVAAAMLLFEPEERLRAESAALRGIGGALIVLAGWRLLAIYLTLGMGMSADPIGPKFFFHSFQIVGWLFFGVRVLIGVLMPGFLAWLAIRMSRLGEDRAAAQQFAPALVMVVIGETVGAGLTFGLLGLGV